MRRTILGLIALLALTLCIVTGCGSPAPKVEPTTTPATDDSAEDVGETDDSGETEPAESYAPRVVLDIEYGPQDGQPGYEPPLESDELAPDAIAASDDGRLYVSDPVKSRVMIFDTEGTYLGSVSRGGSFLVGVAATPQGVGVIDWPAHEFVLLDPDSGTEMLSQPLAEKFRARMWGIHASHEGVWLRTDQGHALVALGAQVLVGVPAANQPRTLIPERAYGIHWYAGDYTSGGTLARTGGGDPDLTLSMGETDLVSMSVAGEDASGAVYVVLGIHGEGESTVRFECRKYSLSGDLLESFALDTGLASTLFGATVDPGGTVYWMTHDDERLVVTAYGPVP